VAGVPQTEQGGVGACIDDPSYCSVARWALAATGTFGTSKSSDTRRDPHSGHMRRLSRRESGRNEAPGRPFVLTRSLTALALLFVLAVVLGPLWR
jgi:hypothetical protein